MTKLYLANIDFLEDPAVFAALYQTVPAHRREKIDHMRYPKDKRLGLGAWLLLMHALEEQGITDRNIRLSYGANGKPYLLDYPKLFFSLSHSGHRVFCAVSDAEVGCDVQKMEAVNRKLADRYFSPEECEAITAASDEERDSLFFRFWTLKESFIKNLGRGLSLSMGDFCVKLTGNGAEVVQQIMPGQNFYFREFALRDGYRYACCARKPEISDIKIVNLL